MSLDLRMSQSHLSPAASDAIEARPACPQFGVKMWLIRIEPIGPQMVKRTFECPACEVTVEK
jgi:hypothetical protein